MSDFFIIGLGNPGEKYLNTRHNVGFLSLDYLASEYNFFDFKENKYHRSLESSALISGKKVTLVKPLTFMNLSGDILGLLKKDGFKNEQLILIYDDIDLFLGSIRIRDKGRAGSHNGVKSIIAHLGTEQFLRIRIGIRPEHKVENLANFVLQNFNSLEIEKLNRSFLQIKETINLVLADKLLDAQTKFNQKVQNIKE